MGASAIAVTPVVAPNAPIAAPQIQSHAYDLTAALDATASPLEIYGTVFNETFDNLGLLGAAVVNNPAPLLRQVLENQKGHIETVLGAFGSIPTSLQTWWEGSNGKARLDQARAALEAGDFGEAYRWFNHSMLYAFNAAFGPLIAPGVFLSGVPRGGTEYIAGIPEQIAQNFTNLVAATFTRAVVVTGLFQGVFGTISGAVFELTRVVGATVEAISKGDIAGAINAVINTPAILANAVLNGFDYADEDPETGTGGYAEWPALLTFAEPGETGAVAGLFQTLLVNIPKQLAAAIRPAEPEVAPLAAAAEVPAGVLDAPVLDTEGQEPAAPAAEVEKSAPVAELVKAETPAPLENEAEGTAPADDAASLDGDATDATDGKVSAADRIKAKISEAKEARQARVQEVKEKVAAAKEKAAEAREARAESRKAGAAKASTSSDSSSSGGSSSSSDSSSSGSDS
ncbi:hypothetical protein A5727_13155 [Mycobacterium sp. ACS4331]|nr:hypothetical protein A5727_13155 [Mycobacterium sp. ACS4331]